MYNVLLSWSHWVQLERNGREGVRIRDYNNNVFWPKCFNINSNLKINKPFNFNISTKLNMNKTYNFNIKNSLNMKKPYNLNKNKTYNF